MTDKELLYVITIAEERNITHAAERLHLAQPSLTQCIRRIEAELGCPLFVRRKYGLDPTEAGKLYLNMAKEILAVKQAYEEKLRLIQNPMSMHLHLGASWYNTLLFLSDAIPEINERFPSMTLSLVEKGTNDLLNMFAEHKLDLILSHEYPRGFEKGTKVLAKDVVRQKLLDESFVLVGHKRFELSLAADSQTVEISNLKHVPFISFNDTQRIRKITDEAFERAGFSTKKVVMTQSFPGAMELAERGVGFAVLPALYVRRNIQNKPNLSCYALPAECQFYWSTYVYYRENDYEKSKVQGVFTILAKVAEKLSIENQEPISNS